MSNITYEYIRRNKDIRTYISSADDALSSIGYTEHSLAHVERAADTAYMILSTLGYPERDCELAQIAAYMSYDKCVEIVKAYMAVLDK